MAKIAIKVSDAELEILKVLWAKGSPMTDRQIRDALGGDSNWKTTTIQTLIKRLLDKGAVQREKKEVFYYMPVLSQADFARDRTEDLVNKFFGGNAKSLISAMLGSNLLSEADMDDLKSYWRERKEKHE